MVRKFEIENLKIPNEIDSPQPLRSSITSSLLELDSRKSPNLTLIVLSKSKNNQLKLVFAKFQFLD